MQAASAETGPNDLQKEATTGPNNLQKGARMPSQTEKWMRRIRSTKTAGRRTVRKRPGDLGRKTNPREGVQSPGVHVDEVDALRSRITRGGGSRWGGGRGPGCLDIRMSECELGATAANGDLKARAHEKAYSALWTFTRRSQKLNSDSTQSHDVVI